MAAEKGRLFLIKRGDGATSETFTNIGGMRSTSLTINNEMVDITNKDSAGFRTLLPDSGVVAFTVSGSGVFVDDATHALIRTSSIDMTIDNYEIHFASGDKYAGAFQATSLEEAGEHNGEVTYSLTLESSAEITFTAA